MSVEVRQSTIAKAGGITFGGTVVNAALTFLMTGVISNSLGTTDTGLFFQAAAVFAIMASALSLGADTALVRALSRERALDNLRALVPTALIAFAPVSVLSVVAAAALWAFAPGLSEVLSATRPDETERIIRSLAPFLPAAPLLGLALGGARGLGTILPYTLLQNIFVPASRVLVVALIVTFAANVESVVLGWASPLAVAGAAAVLVFATLLRRASSLGSNEPRESRSPDSVVSTAKPFWKFALPRGAATLLERALDWSDVLIVVAAVGAAQGGVYAVVTRCTGAGYMVENAARVVTGPRISRALARSDMATAGALFTDVTRALVLAAWPLYWSLIVFAEPVLRLFGPGFESGATALSIISAAMMVAMSAGMLQSFLLMGGRSHWQLMNRALQLTTLIGGCLVLVPRFGIVGAAFAWVAAILLDVSLAAFQVKRRMGIYSSLRLVGLPALAATATFGLGGWILKTFLGETVVSMALSLGVCVAVYVVVCVLWRRQLGVSRLFAVSEGE